MIDYLKVRGFNYQPSYGSTSFENWTYFNHEVIELELRRGKQYFPKMNTVRLWLSWDTYLRDPEKFCLYFNSMLNIVDMLELKAIVILFNRWHDPACDCGGIYIDHFVPGWSTVQNYDMFTPYVKDIVGNHKNDKRIIIWDICNEPFSYRKQLGEMRDIAAAEFKWLQRMYLLCKDLNVIQPVGIGLHPNHGNEGMEFVVPISDIFMIHPYYGYEQDNYKEKEKFEKQLDDYVEISRKHGKPLLVTEACAGSLDDNWRVENIRYTLTEFKKRNLGFVVHALHYSRVSDLHGPEHGPVTDPGNLAFINVDGYLRKGHEIFNEF